MYTLSEKSAEKLSTCHVDIQKIISELLKILDVSVVEGHRTQEQQIQYFKEGKSKLDGITNKSKHQEFPSMAIDIMPYASGENAFSGKELDNRRFYFTMGAVKAISERLFETKEITHKVRFGLDWDSDAVFSDQTFHDLPHFELVKA